MSEPISKIEELSHRESWDGDAPLEREEVIAKLTETVNSLANMAEEKNLAIDWRTLEMETQESSFDHTNYYAGEYIVTNFKSIRARVQAAKVRTDTLSWGG